VRARLEGALPGAAGQVLRQSGCRIRPTAPGQRRHQGSGGRSGGKAKSGTSPCEEGTFQAQSQAQNGSPPSGGEARRKGQEGRARGEARFRQGESRAQPQSGTQASVGKKAARKASRKRTRR